MLTHLNRRVFLPPEASLAVGRFEAALRAAGPPLLFGLRLWASATLALYVAFWLELDNPFWAGTSAAIVCLPQLGASLRKGWFRMIGTFVGAVMSVVLGVLVRIGVVAQLRILCGDAGGLYGGDHRRRPAWRNRWRGCQRRLSAGCDPSQRDLHRHRLRRRRSRRHRPWRRSPAAGRAGCGFGGRHVRWPRRYT